MAQSEVTFSGPEAPLLRLTSKQLTERERQRLELRERVMTAARWVVGPGQSAPIKQVAYWVSAVLMGLDVAGTAMLFHAPASNVRRVLWRARRSVWVKAKAREVFEQLRRKSQ